MTSARQRMSMTNIPSLCLRWKQITPVEVENTVLDGLVIEEYVDDPRGESCLMMHKLNDRCIHVVCAPKLDYLAIITAYIPEEELWENDYKTRK